MKIKFNFCVRESVWEFEFIPYIESNVGLVHYINHTLHILEGCKSFEMTVLHELTHIFMWEYGFGQYETYTREQVCDFVGAYAFSIVNKYNEIESQVKEVKK